MRTSGGSRSTATFSGAKCNDSEWKSDANSTLRYAMDCRTPGLRLLLGSSEADRLADSDALSAVEANKVIWEWRLKGKAVRQA